MKGIASLLSALVTGTRRDHDSVAVGLTDTIMPLHPLLAVASAQPSAALAKPVVPPAAVPPRPSARAPSSPRGRYAPSTIAAPAGSIAARTCFCVLLAAPARDFRAFEFVANLSASHLHEALSVLVVSASDQAGCFIRPHEPLVMLKTDVKGTVARPLLTIRASLAV